MSGAAQAINSLERTVSGFKSRVDVKIDNVHTSTSRIRETTDKIYQSVDHFKTDMMHGEEKQIAHENILRLDQLIKERFSDYVTIRRTIVGVVRDFDINLVRNSTITELSEELWITSSRYWLSYALIAITAWVNDYPEIAKNSLAECVRKDPVKTPLFFCLMNLRFNRIETAKRWFAEYLKTLDPTQLQNETSVLLQAFLNGIFGKDKELEHRVISLIDSWIVQINSDSSIAKEMIDAYGGYIATLPASYKFEYKSLTEHCTNAGALESSLKSVGRFQGMQQMVESLDVETEPQADSNYKSRIDAILNTLISNYDEEELELKNQQDYYRCIVENNGIVENAQAQYAEMQELKNKDYNIGKQMIHWAVYDDNDQTNIHVRKFAFLNTKNWFVSAVQKWSAEVASAFPIEYPIRIDVWSGISNGMDQTEQVEKMKRHYNDNAFQLKFVNNFNIIAAILLVVSAGLAFVAPVALAVTGLSIAFLVYRVLKANKDFPKRVESSLSTLNQCMSELSECRREFEDKLQAKDKLIRSIEAL